MNTDRMKVLITGGSGLLALNWACAVRGQWDVTLGVHHHTAALSGVKSCVVSLDTPQELRSYLDEHRPSLIVHTAGLTNVDRCEQDPLLARHANARIARSVAEAAVASGIQHIHISTDHLFAGRSSLYTEDSPVEPINEYARSKLLAENWVLEANPNALVVRTNFFGWGNSQRQSFSDWLIYGLRAGREMTLFDDVFFTPVIADALVHAAHELSQAGLSGIYNLGGDQRLSKFDFAILLAQRFGLAPELIKRTQISQAHLNAPRPRDMSLDNAKAATALGHGLGTAQESLDELFKQEQQGRKQELFTSVRQR